MYRQCVRCALAWLACGPALVVSARWAALVFEIGDPIFIWPRATRRLWISVTVALHLGIGLFLGLWLFSAMMITLTASAFGAAELEQARLSIRGWIGRIGGRTASRASDAPVWQSPTKFLR